MNYLPIALLVTTGLLTSTAVHAQDVNFATPAQSQSATLVTQPVSVNRSTTSTERGITTGAPYSAERLNGIAGSFQVKPKKTENSIIPASLNNAIAPPPSAPTTIDPIDFFKVPGLDGGVKVRVD